MSKFKMILGMVALVAVFSAVAAPSASAQCFGGGFFGGGFYGGGFYGGGFYTAPVYNYGCYPAYGGWYRPVWGRRCW